MSESLRDQLLKSGLVKRKPAAAAPSAARKGRGKPDARKPGKSKPSKRSDDVDLARAYALRARDEQRERAQAQRDAERRAREKKEQKQKLVALLSGKPLNDTEADVARHFPHRDKIRRIYCTKEQLARLNRGELGVVQLAGRYLLVTREVAQQAAAIQAQALVLLCDPDAAGEDDVPPDLVW